MKMKIIPANGGGPGMDGVFLSGYEDGDYTPRPCSGPLPSLQTHPPQNEDDEHRRFFGEGGLPKTTSFCLWGR